MYHNHEENIKLARKFIGLLIGNRDIDKTQLVMLLESMIIDAETGHAKINQLTKLLEEKNNG